MKEKSTLSIEKETREIVKTVRRKMSYERDKDLTTDETIVELCNLFLKQDEVGEEVPEDIEQDEGEPVEDMMEVESDGQEKLPVDD